MKRIFVPTTGPDDWKRLLAEPDKQWKAGFSAKSLACRWEEADAFPSEVEALFSGSEITRFRKIELIMAFPEHQVPLPGGQGLLKVISLSWQRTRGVSWSP